LAQRYEVSGGDIRNAVLKAALAAAAEPIPDSSKRINQHHFEISIEEVLAAKRVMRQSLFVDETNFGPKAELFTTAAVSGRSLFAAYALPGLALLLALIALLVALIK
jgi:hypothetical protein